MKNKYLGLGVLLSFLLVSAAFAEAQRVNPLFEQARDSARAVVASSLSQDVKQDFGLRWSSLAAEQRSLWMIAGQVDAAIHAGNNPAFLDNYNQRVTAWQTNLQAFSADAANALAQALSQLPAQAQLSV